MKDKKGTIGRSGIVAKRIALCKKCPNLNRFMFCRVCGCYMPAKVRIPSAECPILQWDSHSADDDRDDRIPVRNVDD